MSDLYSYNDWREFLEHREKSAYGSFTWLPGGKNSSEYNHVYYLNNKWRWGIGGDMDSATTVKETKGLVQSILDSTDLDERIAKGVKDVLDKTDIDDKIIEAAKNSRVGRAISETKNVKRQLDNINNQIKNGNRNPDLLRAQSEAKTRYEQTLGGKIEKNLKSIKPARWVRSGKADLAFRKTVGPKLNKLADDIQNDYTDKAVTRLYALADRHGISPSSELQSETYKNISQLVQDAIVNPIKEIAKGRGGRGLKGVIADTKQRTEEAFESFTKAEQYALEREANTRIDSKTGFKLKSEKSSMEDDIERVNPSYKNWGQETKQNCMLCTATYDLRRRGYDVTAKTTGLGFNGLYDLEKWYPGVMDRWRETHYTYDEMKVYHPDYSASKKEYIHENTTALIDMLEDYPNGARGYLQVTWDAGGGHALAWEIQNGHVVVIDAQSGRTYHGSNIENQLLQSTSGYFGFVRLDDLDFDENAIKRVAKS